MTKKNYIKEWGKVMAPDYYGFYELALYLPQDHQIKFNSDMVRVHLLADGKEEYVKYGDLRKVSKKAFQKWQEHRKRIEQE